MNLVFNHRGIPYPMMEVRCFFFICIRNQCNDLWPIFLQPFQIYQIYVEDQDFHQDTVKLHNRSDLMHKLVVFLILIQFAYSDLLVQLIQDLNISFGSILHHHQTLIPKILYLLLHQLLRNHKADCPIFNRNHFSSCFVFHVYYQECKNSLFSFEHTGMYGLKIHSTNHRFFHES